MGLCSSSPPSFKDEGYLETEINYAIKEKRTKGDRFAIITLQFVDAEGKAGEIPELLKTYVWKKPKTSLEALREIVRALPIAPTVVDWREGIGGVVTVPKTRSTSTELSVEAKTILKAATSGDGHILCHRNFGGQTVQVGGKELIPDQSPEASLFGSVASRTSSGGDTLRTLGTKVKCFR